MAGQGGRRHWGWLAVPALVVAGWAGAHGGHGSGSAAGPNPSATATTSPGPGNSASAARSEATASAAEPTSTDPYDPARFSAAVVRYAHQAGIDPQLLMAILYNESYKPHDPAFERAWQRMKPDAAFGIANMHKAAFDQAKQGRSFADRSWQELPDHPDLAVEAAAWYLHDLAAQLPASWPGHYTKDQLLALGYNTGAGNMAAFARGVTPGAQAQSYLDDLRANWSKAGKAV